MVHMRCTHSTDALALLVRAGQTDGPSLTRVAILVELLPFLGGDVIAPNSKLLEPVCEAQAAAQAMAEKYAFNRETLRRLRDARNHPSAAAENLRAVPAALKPLSHAYAIATNRDIPPGDAHSLAMLAAEKWVDRLADPSLRPSVRQRLDSFRRLRIEVAYPTFTAYEAYESAVRSGADSPIGTAADESRAFYATRLTRRVRKAAGARRQGHLVADETMRSICEIIACYARRLGTEPRRVAIRCRAKVSVSGVPV